MRIAFSGTGNSGKTTLLRSFLYSWDNYTTPEKTYREVLKEQNLPHSSTYNGNSNSNFKFYN